MSMRWSMLQYKTSTFSKGEDPFKSMNRGATRLRSLSLIYCPIGLSWRAIFSRTSHQSFQNGAGTESEEIATS